MADEAPKTPVPGGDTTVPTTPTTTHTPHGGTTESMVPSFRLREESDRRQAAEARATAADGKYTALETEHAGLMSRYESLQLKYDSDLALTKAGIEDAEVQGFFRERFQAAQAQAAEADRKPFTDWFRAQQENPSPILKPYFPAKPEPKADPKTLPDPLPGPKAPTVVPPPAPNPERGVGQPAGTHRTWTADQIAEIRRQYGGTLGPYKAEILASFSGGKSR